jgi:hypothetical protein
MEATTLAALVVAANRDDERTRSLDGPWSTELLRRSQGRSGWPVPASALLALATRILLRHRDVPAPRASVTTN